MGELVGECAADAQVVGGLLHREEIVFLRFGEMAQRRHGPSDFHVRDSVGKSPRLDATGRSGPVRTSGYWSAPEDTKRTSECDECHSVSGWLEFEDTAMLATG